MAHRVISRFREDKAHEAATFIFSAATALGIVSFYADSSKQLLIEAEALATLNLAIDAGYNNLDYIMNDPDVAPLRAISGVDQVIQRLRQ